MSVHHLYHKNQVAYGVQAGIESENYTKRGHVRVHIRDLCDFCLQVVLVKRDQIVKRKFGYKFGCFRCHEQCKFKWKKEGSEENILPCINV
jgi:hypothetical protein